MIVYRFIHQTAIIPQTSINTQSGCVYNTEYVPDYRLYRLRNGGLTIELYAPIANYYKIILEVLHNYVKLKSAEITIVTSLGQISQIFIQPKELQPNYVGNEIPRTDAIYQQVANVVYRYYPNFEYHEFPKGFLVRPLGFINVSYWNDFVSGLIEIFKLRYEVWVSFAANRGIVISFERISHLYHNTITSSTVSPYQWSTQQ